MEYVEIFQKYMGSGLVVILFLAAILYLFFNEKRKSLRILFIYLPVLVLLLYFNPLFYQIFYAVAGSEIYFRVLWLLPITPVLAYTCISIYGRLGEKQKLPVLALMLVLLALCGRLVYSNPLFSRAENKYHVPDYVVEICDAIEVEGREVMAVFPKEFLLYVRQYSPVVCMPYGRDGIIYQGNAFYNLMESGTIPVDELVQYARSAHCHYIILDQEDVLVGNLLDYDYEVFDQIGEYIIYRDTMMYIGV